MRYEEPKMDVVWLSEEDVFTGVIQASEVGTGNETDLPVPGGDWDLM